MKKLLSLLLALALALALLVPAFAEEANTADGDRWTPWVIAQAEENEYEEAPWWMKTIAILLTILGSVLCYMAWPLVPIVNLFCISFPWVFLLFPLMVMSIVEQLWNGLGYTVFSWTL